MNLPVSFKHAAYELQNILKHPEQLLLILGTPIGLLFAFKNYANIANFSVASCALASSFTSVAINTSFARRYGTLKYLSVTPVGLKGIVGGQTMVGICLLILQLPVVFFVTDVIQINSGPDWKVFAVLPILILFFTQLAFLLSSVLSAEKVLAFANLAFLALLASGLMLWQSEYAFFHPIAGVVQINDSFLGHLAVLSTSNFVVFFALRRYFRWID